MKDAGVDLVVACMDSNAVVLLAEEMTKQRMDAIQYIANGYDADLLAESAGPLDGSVIVTQFATFEVEDPPEGLQDYLTVAVAADAGVCPTWTGPGTTTVRPTPPAWCTP